MHNKLKYIAVLVLFFSLASCAQIGDITKSLMDLKNLDFKLSGIEQVRLSGVSFSKGMKLSDLSITDIAKLTSAATKSSIPIDFILNLEARNPNEDKGKKFKTTATLESFDFDVFLDGSKAFTGGLADPVKIESNGGTKVIPLKISFDLTKVVQDKQYSKFANIAMNLAGFDTQKTKIKVEATPVVSTAIGKLKPGRINITETEY